ncbi:MAG: hypothetical protein ABJG47_13280 [Ekhidna sp.]
MRDSITKFMLVMILIVLCLLAFGQSKTSLYERKNPSNDGYLEVVLTRLSVYEQGISYGEIGKSMKSVPKKEHVGITHLPSLDFNIYLTFYRSISPRTLTSLEISLNYTGVMNVRNLIFLRKKDR